MERRIEIRSDYDTLKTLQKETRKSYIENQIKENKSWIKYLAISSAAIIFTFLLTSYKLEIIVLTILSGLGFLTFILIILNNLIKNFFIIRKYNRQFKSFIKIYEGIPVIFYSFNEDTLSYDGHLQETYRWSEFKDVIISPNSFWLITDIVERNIWIPKSAMINQEDYEYFKKFAEVKLKNKSDEFRYSE